MNTKVKAKIELSYFEGMVSVTGTAENLDDGMKNLSYTLSVIKKNKKTANTSKNSQNGEFTLNPNEKKILSTTKINQSTQDEIIILLLIYDDNNVMVGKDRIIVEEKKSEALNKNEAELEITGIVSDDTKTKIGKDFYDIYFSKYNSEAIKGNQIVQIEEQLNIGRTTILKITIDNKLISEFIANPNEEFLSQKAEEAIQITKKYFKDLEKLKNRIEQY
ncbi:MAG: curli production assembly/transport protein CsgE [Flavobacterium sp.]|uniref:curli-like amyloid fiber formation chaperone CsgH n=1 Tax=Flavobacterium sp. TaxID=239 RepID=UPI0025BCBBEB|nr:curli-like amyloid fiber formation chaperone CsgH [Flavobacterium sp.]MCA1965864.1 curli production assembly/transport protein CsgE [Flavobacterium sp.]